MKLYSPDFKIEAFEWCIKCKESLRSSDELNFSSRIVCNTCHDTLKELRKKIIREVIL